MNYLFELSKEHKTLPKAEILACLQAEDIDNEIIESNEDVLVISTNSKNDQIKDLSSRLSYTFHIDELLYHSKPDINSITNRSINNSLKREGSIAIKYKNRSKNIDSQPIVKALANIYTKDRDVALENPENEVRGFITDSKVYVGLKIAEINRTQFEERKVQYRPYFSPISLHPKLARALVNLSAVKKGETLLDPFCGTGGILIEAGLIGVNVIGNDIEEKMIEGCKKTLDFYKVKNYELYHLDIGNLNRHTAKVDAIVTDLPYGKSTTTKGEDMRNLYKRAFKSMSTILKEGGIAVIGLSNENLISFGKEHFTIIEKFDFKVHKSLVRHFVVFKK